MAGRPARTFDRLILVGLVLGLPGVAHASYLDPGTGSLVLQLALAGLLGALFTLKIYWRRLKAWIAPKPPPDAGDSPQGGRPDDPR